MRKQRIRATLILLGALLASPLWAAETTNKDTASSSVGLAAQVKEIFRSRCLDCHGDRRQASGVHFLKPETYIGPDGSVVPGDADASLLFDYISSDDESFRMPEPPRAPLSESEIDTIRGWIEAGAEPFPGDVEVPEEDGDDPSLAGVVGAEYVLNEILAFVKATPRDDRPFLRFFSSNHRLVAGITKEVLIDNRHALAKAINHLSWQPDIVTPKIVDEIGSIFAVDTRDLGWQATPFTQVDRGTAKDDTSFDLYDQVLLEYPYGVAFESSETFDELFEVYLNGANLVRPIPYVRIDWFVSSATQSPLYEDMLQLPHQLSELEQMLGVDGETNLTTFVAKRAGMTLSGVSQNNRVVERHPARYGAYWKSYDFESSRGLQNMFVDPIDFHYAGGEMIWNLPNGLQAYLITNNTGDRINDAPTDIVTDKFAADKVVRNGLACMRCHDQGIKRFADNVRSAFEPLSDSHGINRRDVLKLYPVVETMDQLLDKDTKRFTIALQEAMSGDKRDKSALDPLTPVAKKYMDVELTLSEVAAELGLKEPGSLEAVFRLPQFTQLGLAQLGSGGVIRRDTWEDYFETVVSQLGLGIPVTSVDALTRPDRLSGDLAFGLNVSTNQRSNVFAPGDEMVISVKNDTGADMFIELVGTGTRGRKDRLTDGVVPLRDGETYRFPEQGAITIRPQLGEEFITVFASGTKFEPGILLRSENTSDRIVHDIFQYDPSQTRIDRTQSQMIKKTLKIETR